MNVVLSMAISPNGLIAREDGREDWLPSENWDDFLVDAKAFNNIVMGRETYELVKKLYADYNFDNVDIAHKVIITRNQDFKAEGYAVVHSPEEAVTYLRQQSIDNVLLIGGGKLNTEFIKASLVDEIWLTVTPYIIGKGRPFISPEDFDLPLIFKESKQLSGGRVQLKYRLKEQS